jgi:hypothetical protein
MKRFPAALLENASINQPADSTHIAFDFDDITGYWYVQYLDGKKPVGVIIYDYTGTEELTRKLVEDDE